ncbi:GIY-YIG nuclease family protein, partial [Algoriphagus antarcticus]
IDILHSTSADKFYVGHSNNPKRRITEHNESTFHTYTSKFRSWEVVLFQVAGSQSDALRIEKQKIAPRGNSMLPNLILETFNIYSGLVYRSDPVDQSLLVALGLVCFLSG